MLDAGIIVACGSDWGPKNIFEHIQLAQTHRFCGSGRSNAGPAQVVSAEQALAMWDVPPSRLTLEITESAIMGDVERAIVLLHQVRDLGVRLSIDDFGTGHSSLAYLKRFPVHELKIDKLFVQGMRRGRGDVQIVRAIVDLAHAFELETVAEGVEDTATLELLRGLGCDVVQGFLFGGAMAERDFAGWAANREGILSQGRTGLVLTD